MNNWDHDCCYADCTDHDSGCWAKRAEIERLTRTNADLMGSNRELRAECKANNEELERILGVVEKYLDATEEDPWELLVLLGRVPAK